MTNIPILQMRNIDKRFGGIHALKDFSFDCLAGETHVLMGENGAGKSTLLNILGGITKTDNGTILIDGTEIDIKNPLDALNQGIAIIHQELSLCKNMTIAENIFRGQNITKGVLRIVDFKTMNKQTQVLLKQMNLDLNASELVGNLSIAQQQMIEIVSAVSKKGRIVVMDEPTASLTEKEVDSLFNIISTLKARNVAIIYVSHRIRETFEIGDRVSIMRDGQFIGTRKVSETTSDELVEMMVGRPIQKMYGTKLSQPSEEVVLEVKNFKNKKINNVSFQLHKSEVLGFSGLVGAGRTELARAIFGLDKLDEGEILIKGKKAIINGPKDAIHCGIGLVPEDRKGSGLILNNTFGFNLTITVLDRFIKGLHMDFKKEREIINLYKDKLTIKATGPEQKCMNLSGGNQQKVVIAKWLATESKILILDEPTRGVDVGTKAEIFKLIHQLAADGVSIIFISSDLPEIINMVDRVLVMREGSIAGIIDSEVEEISQRLVMKYATGGIFNEK
ncbi:MAG: sugar ABC transporter ATP-binding protein [Christensenellales bacterium]